MLHREILSPKEMIEKMPRLSEGLFAIRCELATKTYQTILYKYQEDYFLVENPSLMNSLMKEDRSFFGTPEQLLNEIEKCFEDNYYQSASKEWVELDLNTLKLIDKVEIKFFDLEE